MGKTGVPSRPRSLPLPKCSRRYKNKMADMIQKMVKMNHFRFLTSFYIF